MSYQLNRLTGIAEHNGWDVQPRVDIDGDSRGFTATRGGKAVTVTIDRQGRVVDIQHSDHPFTRHLNGRADTVAEWLVEEER